MSELFYSLALLACPVGMGVMMWLMMRGKGHDASHTSDGAPSGDEITRLRAEVDQLRTAQRLTGGNRSVLDPNDTQRR